MSFQIKKGPKIKLRQHKDSVSNSQKGTRGNRVSVHGRDEARPINRERGIGGRSTEFTDVRRVVSKFNARNGTRTSPLCHTGCTAKGIIRAFHRPTCPHKRAVQGQLIARRRTPSRPGFLNHVTEGTSKFPAPACAKTTLIICATASSCALIATADNATSDGVRRLPMAEPFGGRSLP